MNTNPLVIGVGNLYSCDDAAGILVARQLREIADDRFVIIESTGDGASLVECWKDQKHIILVDAVSSGAEPGTLHRINANEKPIASKFFACSSHSFGVAEAIELSRAMGQLPNQLQVYGIEGKTFQSGQELSPEVERAMAIVIKEILGQGKF